MNGWQIEAMIGQECAEAWERLNAPDPDAIRLAAAGKELLTGCSLIDVAEDYLVYAMDRLTDTPMEAKIGSFLDQLQDLRCDIKSLANTYAKGVRE